VCVNVCVNVCVCVCVQEPHASRGGPNSRGKGVQVVGEAGDLLVWHGWLIHSGSQNACTFPRLALLGSFRNTAMCVDCREWCCCCHS
jgi:ectoine hydroxylase-related dioxygenase (phytanoyl-CoA dioxygenase family)